MENVDQRPANGWAKHTQTKWFALIQIARSQRCGGRKKANDKLTTMEISAPKQRVNSEQ